MMVRLGFLWQVGVQYLIAATSKDINWYVFLSIVDFDGLGKNAAGLLGMEMTEFFLAFRPFEVCVPSHAGIYTVNFLCSRALGCQIVIVGVDFCREGLRPCSTSINKAEKEIKNGQRRRFVWCVSFSRLDKLEHQNSGVEPLVAAIQTMKFNHEAFSSMKDAQLVQRIGVLAYEFELENMALNERFLPSCCLCCDGMDGLHYPPRHIILTKGFPSKELCDAKDAEVCIRALENQIAELVSQPNIEEQECQAEINACNQVQAELINLEGRRS
ncbi:hypothetical protein RHSIM_Rhsim07G0133700 [Rhododendron simsii]|uniref:Uncharacterized protein n=1 Tax=Rhododendron simsii TaxID=118357 RepID=A0A834GNC0_RHOSS|nr:hypothetical protein RHSIM_Rhsim07G0133700 [Rhododendron simsii]